MALSRVSPIGLDFGEHAVKVAQLERRGDNLRLRSARSARIESGGDTPAERRARVLDAARRALRGGRFRGEGVVCALSPNAVTTRHIRVPSDRVDQAGEYLANELRDPAGKQQGDLTLCPIPVADLLEHGEQKREYLCCIAGAAEIQDRVEMVEQLGLVPVAIDLEACAQVRPFVGAGNPACFMHIDLGCHRTRITVAKSGTLVLTRSAPVGGTALVDALTSHLQVDLETLLDLASCSDDDVDGLHTAITGALAEPLDIVLDRVADCVRYCGALFQGRAVSLVRVAGGVAPLPGIVPYLSRRIGIRTVLADPFAALESGGATDAVNGDPNAFVTALGLAMREVAA